MRGGGGVVGRCDVGVGRGILGGERGSWVRKAEIRAMRVSGVGVGGFGWGCGRLGRTIAVFFGGG